MSAIFLVFNFLLGILNVNLNEVYLPIQALQEQQVRHDEKIAELKEALDYEKRESLFAMRTSMTAEKQVLPFIYFALYLKKSFPKSIWAKCFLRY